MKIFSVETPIYTYHDFSEFTHDYGMNTSDLIITNKFIYEPFMEKLKLKCGVIFQEEFGTGEPSDKMLEGIIKEVSKKEYKRIIAVGGGTILDIAKILSLEGILTVEDIYRIFEKKAAPIKKRELILIPTTCGTGSEMTNLSIVEFKEKNTKIGFGCQEMFADAAILIAEMVKTLPFKFFVFSSVDALIHASESFLSPKANVITQALSEKAIRLILDGYTQILEDGHEVRFEKMEDFLMASTMAGIAFGNAGCAAVHAMSYPLSGNYHVPHGEANSIFFTSVFRRYRDIKPFGKIRELETIFASILNCNQEQVYDYLDDVISKMIDKKLLREYGMEKEEISDFSKIVINTQQRLMNNNYVKLEEKDIINIYKKNY